jgi:hypothetical protein
LKAFLPVKDQTYQLTGAQNAEDVLEVAVSALALALAIDKSPQECQRLHCVLSVTGI